MADEATKPIDFEPKNDENNDENDTKGDDNLEDFITEQYKKQKAERAAVGEVEIDDDRTANFFARALGESQRMSQEVEKSQYKMVMLHEELGGERMGAWQSEHATEVLSPQQVAAVTNAAQGNF